MILMDGAVGMLWTGLVLGWLLFWIGLFQKGALRRRRLPFISAAGGAVSILSWFYLTDEKALPDGYGPLWFGFGGTAAVALFIRGVMLGRRRRFATAASTNAVSPDKYPVTPEVVAPTISPEPLISQEIAGETAKPSFKLQHLAAPLIIDYEDSQHRKTSRRIVVHDVEFQIRAGSKIIDRIGAYCLERKANRTFVFSRIHSAAKLETGEVIQDLSAYLFTIPERADAADHATRRSSRSAPIEG